MAEKSKPILTPCFVWDTRRPAKDQSLSSSDFLFLGAKCCLTFQHESHHGHYCISLNRYTDAKLPGEPFYVVTSVQNHAIGGSHRCLSSYADIAPVESKKKTQIWSHVDDKKYWREDQWRVTCVFQGVISSDFQSQNRTIQVIDAADKAIQSSVEIPPDTERLCDDFSNMLVNEIFPDVKLNCAGQTRSAHKSVLAARSEVFSAMFRNRMVESETGSVDIKDLDVEILDLLLQYVYTGKFSDLTNSTSIDLYEAGDKYAMSSLKTACSNWMVRNMSEGNCITFLSVADAHSDGEFKRTVMTFIFDHPTVFRSDAWVRLKNENPKLACEAIESYAFDGRSN